MKTIAICFATAALSALTVGCAVQPPLNTAVQVAASSHSSNDPYTKTASVNGPTVTFGQYGLDTYLLSAARTGTNKHAELFVRVWRSSAEGWLFLETAHDIDGKSIPIHIVSREVESGGSISEVVAVDFPKGYLGTHLATGMNVRLDGSRGSVTVVVPSHYVQGFVAAIGANPAMH